MNFKERINAAIEYSELTQGKIAAKVRDMEGGENFSQQQLSKLARGIDDRTSYITHIAMACGVRPEWLAANQGDMLATAPRIPEKDLEAFFRLYGYTPTQPPK